MKKWLKDIIYALEHPKYKQIRGVLTQKDSRGKIVGKCAMGEINCQIRKKGTEAEFVLNTRELRQLGVPEYYIRYKLPHMSTVSGIFPDGFELAGSYNIQSYITTLNDIGFKYSQIAEFLRITFGEEE